MSVKMPLYAYSAQKKNAPERMLFFREQKKQRQRQDQTDRRKAELSLDAFYNAQQAKENRRRKMEAQAAFQKRKKAE
ncbi:MAG: hypothetical protein IJO21_02850 [Oscillospiraceae bacterium]|nr:hypothetical protein [Oscillospiraceae bacterium]